MDRHRRSSFFGRPSFAALALLLLSFGRAGMTARSGPAETVAQGMIGYWPFDGSGIDRSPSGKNLVLYGSPVFATSGKFGYALDLHGDPTQYAARTIDDAIYNLGRADYSIQFWARLRDPVSTEVIIDKLNGCCGPQGWSVATHGSDWELGPYFGAPAVVTPNEWQHVVIRRAGNLSQILLNGASILNYGFAGEISAIATPLFIGRRNDGTYPVNGLIDDVAVWNRALSDEEVAYLYNGGAGNPVLPTPLSFSPWNPILMLASEPSSKPTPSPPMDRLHRWGIPLHAQATFLYPRPPTGSPLGT